MNLPNNLLQHLATANETIIFTNESKISAILKQRGFQ
ncbi:MAG: hypothetical protein UW40_C0014G0003 [Parcubacteria group bacterium GW2011_GWF2_44_17]|nr:MAG: hypothetical protein UW40_C0014G0003 [Parcubacteria group bacterium GW2011_GWF2_44_17]